MFNHGGDAVQFARSECSTLGGVFSKDGKNFKLSFCGKSYTVPLSTESDCGKFQGVEYGDIVHFRFEGDDIKVLIDLGAVYEKFAIPDYFTTIEATVKFDGNSFALEDYSLSIAPD